MSGGLDSTLMLKSEHLRILRAAQQRYDNTLREHRQIGFWKGVACTVWIVGLTSFGSAVVAFNLGLNLQ